MNSLGGKKPRVVIYGVGQYGGYLTRYAVEKGWTIAAAFNRAGPKVGQDLGQVVGLERDLGVEIQDCETARYDNLDADIGLVAQTNFLKANWLAYRRLMNAGLNVGCHGTESYFPWGSDPEMAAEIDTLAKKNGVTFTGSGIWDTSRIWSGLLALGQCTQIQSLHHSSLTDVHGQSAVPQHARQIGCGMTLGEYDASGLRQSPLPVSYRTIPQAVLFGAGFTVTETKTRVEPIMCEEPIDSPLLGHVPEGRCAGSRVVVDINTREGVTATADIELRLTKPGEVEHMFWEVNGRPTTRVRVERDDTAHATAANLFNRIPGIIAAPPGVVTVAEMGLLQHSALI
jgi:4-hydroxy-tetrahydrodipicolinate reductase